MLPGRRVRRCPARAFGGGWSKTAVRGSRAPVARLRRVRGAARRGRGGEVGGGRGAGEGGGGGRESPRGGGGGQPGCVRVVGECVQVGVGGCVVGLAGVAEDSRHGGEEYEARELDAAFGGQFVQV